MPDDENMGPPETRITAATIQTELIERTGAQGSAVPSTGRRPFRGIHPELTPDELGTPGAQKMLVDLIATQDVELDELKGFREKYHISNTESSVLRERLASLTEIDKIRTICIAVGGALIGYVPNIWELSKGGAICIGIAALALLISQFLSRRRRREN